MATEDDLNAGRDHVAGQMTEQGSAVEIVDPHKVQRVFVDHIVTGGMNDNVVNGAPPVISNVTPSSASNRFANARKSSNARPPHTKSRIVAS